MNLSTSIVVVGVTVLLSSGAFTNVIHYLTESPIPTWAALLFVIPMILIGLLAIAKGNIDAEDEAASKERD